MPFTPRTDWQNDLAGGTPLMAADLLRIEAGIAEALSGAQAAGAVLAVTAATPTSNINAWLADSSAIGVKKLIGTAVLTAPLILPSGTYLDASSATITSGFVGNMLRNENAAGGGTRDKNITIIGGTWQRNAGGPASAGVDGDANGAHSIYLRHVDRLTIRGLAVGSTGGKYMVAVGDVTNFHISEITGTTLSSDTVHITGPASNGVVELITVTTGGDDVVAITTTDYAAYSDTHGDVTDVTIRNIKGGNTTRVVLIAGASYAAGTGDGHLLDRIVVDTVTQTGSGATVWTGAGGSTDILGSITISHVYGGVIQLRHPNHKTVVVTDAPKGIIPATQDTNTVINIGRLVVKDTTAVAGNVVMLNNAGIVIDNLELQNVTSVYGSIVLLSVGIVKRLTMTSCAYAGTNDMIAISGTLNALVVNSTTITQAAGTHVVRMNGSGVLGSVTFNDCTVGAADTSSGILVNVSSASATAAAITVSRGVYTGIGRFLEKATGAAGTTVLRATDCVVTGANRLAQVAGGTLDFAYSNISLSGILNQPVRVYNGASAVISGSGWKGYTASAAVRAATEAIQVLAADFPVDLSILTKANGDKATNTNAALACGVGPAVSNGTAWKNIYTGTTY